MMNARAQVHSMGEEQPDAERRQQPDKEACGVRVRTSAAHVGPPPRHLVRGGAVPGA